MKPSTTLAATAMLALGCWAAAPRPPLAPAPPFTAAMFQGDACPSPSAPAKKAWKPGTEGTEEYTAFTAAASSKDPTQQAQLAAAFVQKYPDSDYKDDALQIELQAQYAVPSHRPEAVKTAQTLLRSPGATAQQLLIADTIISFVLPSQVQTNDPDLAAKMATLSHAATCGQQLLASAPAAQQSRFGPIMAKALGFAQLNTKQYDAAIATLSKAAQQNPKDPLLYYWMGVSEVTKPTPDFITGIFDLAKASALAPETQAFSSYLNTVYTTYHGSTDGLQDVLATAKQSDTPPAGFHIGSKVDVENAAAEADYQAKLKALQNQLPPEDSFAGIKARLLKPDMAASEWKKVKGVGYELEGVVTKVTPKSVDIAVGVKDASASPAANVRLILAAPLTKKLAVGTDVTFDGVADAFRPNPPDPNTPFLLTLNQGSVKGYSPTGK
ncbi:MAG: hypothetical protein ACRD1M_07540 [Terriglobales bacterium]